MITTSHSLNAHGAWTNPDAASQISPFRFARSSDAKVRASRILIVDDEPAVGLLLQKYLGDSGFRDSDVSTDGAGAFERISDSSPDLILLDVHLGNANGLEILQQLRGTSHLEHTPVIILTQSDDEQTKITALNLGANDFLTKPVIVSELVARVRNTLAARAYRDEAIRCSLLQESDVLHDVVTGLPNRRGFDYELKRRMSEWSRNDTPFTLLMVAVDRFKVVSEERVQRFCDTTLRSIADVLRSSVREMDLVSRYNDEVFGLILPSTHAGLAVQVCRQLQQAVSQTAIEHEGHPVPISVSVGLAGVIPDDDATHLTQRADMALSAARHGTSGGAWEHNGAACVSLAHSRSQLPVIVNGNASSGPQLNQDVLTRQNRHRRRRAGNDCDRHQVS